MDRLSQGEGLAQGQSIQSPDGRYDLTMQPDGNLVLSGVDGTVRWASGTNGNAGATLAMQPDGNLVVYSPTRAALWSSQTWGHPGASVVMQSDGNLVVYAAGTRAALWATNTWLASRTVDGFLPSASGLPFINNYPPGTRWPALNLPVVGTVVSGDAGNGLCGGFGFTVVDMFCASPRLVVSRTTPRPPAEGAQFEYLTGRLLDTFNGAIPYGTILKLIDWIETPSGDGLLRHGLGDMMAVDEWPGIKRDIDANRPSPIVLVGPPKSGLGDVSAIKQALSESHQVVAFGYTLSPSDVTIHVYDPNNPTEDNATLTVSLAHADQPVTTTNMGREVRGLFRTHYSWHDPRPVWG